MQCGLDKVDFVRTCAQVAKMIAADGESRNRATRVGSSSSFAAHTETETVLDSAI